MSWEVRQGDALSLLREMPDGIVQTVVTSPPYWGLRDYGSDGQLGLEPTPEQYVQNLVEVFREVRRVLRDDGTVWLNLGDSYAGSWGNQGRKLERGTQRPINGEMLTPVHDGRYPDAGSNTGVCPPGLKPKDLCGIPWRVAFALQQDGWWLRSDIIWAKPNPMPESVTDRPTRSHEYIFLLSKSARYFYDADAVREAWADDRQGADGSQLDSERNRGGRLDGFTKPNGIDPSANGGRNKRSVWTVATQPYSEAHFATFPPKLIEPCILAGSSPKACAKCGAPWMRVVERTLTQPGTTGGATWAGSENEATDVEGARQRLKMRGGGFGGGSVNTVGWNPGCNHGSFDGQSVVLDPFCGSGTMGLVALRHDRSFIGLELNPEYVEMARQRIVWDAPLLNSGLEAA